MNLVTSLTLLSILTITGSSAFQQISRKSVCRPETEGLLEATGSSQKLPPVGHLEQPHPHQLGSQKSTETAAVQDGVKPLSSLEVTDSPLKRNRDCSDYSSLLPSSDHSRNGRFSLNCDMNELENQARTVGHSNAQNNFMDSSFYSTQTYLEEILLSYCLEGPFDSLTSIHDGIALKGFDQFPPNLSFNPDGRTSHGVSDIFPKSDDGPFADVLSSQPYASSQSRLRHNAFPTYEQQGSNQKAVDHTQGASHSNSDHITKSNYGLQSEDHQIPRKQWKLAINKHVNDFENHEFQLYSNHISSIFWKSSYFQNGILVIQQHLQSFFNSFSNAYSRSPEVIAQFGSSKYLTSIKANLLKMSTEICIAERETWLTFFNKKYGLRVENYNLAPDPRGAGRIFPVYLFYVEMINEIIPPAELSEGEISLACISYRRFIEGYRKEGGNKDVLEKKFRTKDFKCSKSLLWDFLGFWMKNYRVPLFQSVEVEGRTNYDVNQNMKAFFNCVFSVYVQGLTKKWKEILRILK